MKYKSYIALFIFLFQFIYQSCNYKEDGIINFSHDSGFYDSKISLSLKSNNNDKIIYTLDGSIPDINNVGGKKYKIKACIDCEFEYRIKETFVYHKPIEINDRSYEKNNVSVIPNSYIKFNPPKFNLHKATVIRAALHNKSKSEVITKVYFISDDLKKYLSLPVLSLVIEEDDFWGYEKGIYVPGKNFNPDNLDYSGNHFQRGSDWERPVYAEYFNNDGESEFSQLLGIRIHGGTSRKFSNKSLRLYARAKYGKNVIEYPFFQNRNKKSYKRLKLRTSGQDIIHSYIRDPLMCNLMINTEVYAEDYLPVNLFINGEYWGIFNLRERFDNHYIERKYGINRNKVEILQKWKDTNEHYEEFREYIKTSDPKSDVFFENVNRKINIQSLLDLRIAEIFFGRWDIHWKIWRDGTNEDAKWNWILWDMDVGMGLPNEWGPEWSHHGYIDANYLKPFLTFYQIETLNMEFSTIMQNVEIRNIFINRFAELMSTNLSEKNILNKIDFFKSRIELAMPKHVERWKSVEGIKSIEHWYESIKTLRYFAKNRHKYIYNQIIEYFDLSGVSKVYVKNISNSEEVYINDNKISDLIKKTPEYYDNNFWACNYFKEIPIKLSISDDIKDNFSHWIINQTIIKDDSVILELTSDAYTIEAIFNN